jgi:hypothetical protein
MNAFGHGDGMFEQLPDELWLVIASTLLDICGGTCPSLEITFGVA